MDALFDGKHRWLSRRLTATTLVALPGRLQQQEGNARKSVGDRAGIGLAAIGTARVWSIVHVDTRLVVIQSLGAEFQNRISRGRHRAKAATKVMSDEFIKAEMAFSPTKQKRLTSSSTALIPGKKHLC